MKKKVAVIHDWLTGMRGGENVLEKILEIFPGADVFTLFLEKDKISEKIRSHRIITSSLNKYRFIRNRYPYFLPFFPSAIEAFNVQAYDVIISSSHCVANGIIPGPGSLHIGYTYSPMRYIWDQYDAYFGNAKGLKRLIIERQVSRLRVWDGASSLRVDHFVAISNFVRKRIWKYYRRDADVIYPPVDTDFFQPADTPKGNYFLTVSALVPYKKIQLLIEAFNRLQERLVIIGSGPEEKKLKRIAGKFIEFKKNLSPGELRTQYQNARAYVFAGIEDFGISFVEAQACGIPVVAYREGGILDIVKDDESGILFNQQSIEGIVQAIEKLKKKERREKGKFSPARIRKNSLRFSAERFKKDFIEYVQEKS